MVRKLLTMVAASALVVAPTAAQAAAPLSLAHMSDVRAGMSLEGASALEGDTAPVVLGLILVILLAVVAVGGNRDEPSNSP